MCGICGFVGAGSREDLERMTTALAHRGPDGFGYWHESAPPVFLGHRRLSVIDLAGGHQPMTTTDGRLVIVFNGEIYNHHELRKELENRGHSFCSDHSDTEVLLHGYREWGQKLPQLLNGMWAFAIYDADESKLFCSRDRFGKKPFYYLSGRRGFIFASELSALTKHPAVPRTISKRALQKYFAYGYIPSPLSIYEAVKKLPGGCSLYVDIPSGDCRVERYWEFLLEPFEQIPRNPEEEWGGRIRDLLDRAVKRRLIGDVPFGVFLSGGIDSSAVTAFASRHVSEGKLKTFNVRFSEKSFDESAYAERISQIFKTDHHSETLSLQGADALVGACLGRLDEPIGDSSLLPTYLLNRFTRRHVTFALGGDGGDELFAGYDPFRALKRARLYQKLFPQPIHAAIKAVFDCLPVSHANLSLDFKIKRTLRGLGYGPRLWLPVWMGPLDLPQIEELFSEKISLEDLYSEAIEEWDACLQPDLVDKTLQFYTRLYLQEDILVKVDRTSMMHSLEVRAPFLDRDLVDFVRRIPSAYKLRNGITKYILKKALDGILPDDILYRPKKGFGTPIGPWFKNSGLQLNGTAPAMLRHEFIRRKLAHHMAGKSDERGFLWNMFVLNKWRETNAPAFPE